MKYKRIERIALIIGTMFAILGAITGNAQDTIRTAAPHDSTCRCGSYTAKDGSQYRIYVGPRGGMYIWVTRKNGTMYKKYVKDSGYKTAPLQRFFAPIPPPDSAKSK